MAGIFETVYNGLGISFEVFEIVFSSAIALLIVLVTLFLITLKRQGGVIKRSKAKIKEMNEDLDEATERVRGVEGERTNLVGQHEEALSKLKEAKEIILKREDDFKDYTSKFNDDITKVSAMDEELKTYRIKLGELKKEKNEMMAGYESEKESEKMNFTKLKEKFDRESEAQKKKTASVQEDLEEEMLRKERKYEKRIDDIKSSTKEAMLKLNKEKDSELEELQIEIDRLKKQVEKLKDNIRVLEIERL